VCIELPGTVIGLDGELATVDFGDRTLEASTLIVPDVALGDPVVVLAGMIVARLTASEAADIRLTLTSTAAEPA
jgi:hydrogenase maturation factor